MRRAVTAVAAACLLIGPTILAFFSGGFFSEPRLIAAIAAWTLVLALTVRGPAPLPRSTPGRLALGGLVLLTAWSALSLTWAPLRGAALDNVQILVLYAGALVLASELLREPRVLRVAEPALAAGATVVIAYGLAGRLLPDLIELARSQSAGGRLEQPITYWNAEGALAAIGLVLGARLSGDGTRAAALRAAATAAAAPLGAGVYLSYSRGAIAVAVLGLAILVALTPTKAQLRAAVLALVAAAIAAASSAAFPGVAALEGTHPARDGAAVLVLLALTCAGAAAVTLWRPATDGGVLPGARRLAPLAVAAVAAVLLGLVVAGLNEKPSAAELATGASASRLTTVSSNRHEYWRVALEAFEDNALAGVGSGGFRVEWLRERSIPESVQNAHSLEIEIAAELGLVGLLGVGLLIGGVGIAAGRALRRHRVAAAGPTAAVVAWLLHASIDWDWQLPAVTLPAIVLAGALVALSERPATAPATALPADHAGASRPAFSGAGP
jgi:O-antigen ligase